MINLRIRTTILEKNTPNGISWFIDSKGRLFDSTPLIQ